MKSYAKSKTIWGAVVAFSGGAITLISSPAFHGQVGECLSALGQENHAATLATLSPMVAMLGGLIAAYGRTQAKGQIYTPKGLPGSDKVVREVWSGRRENEYEVPDRWE